MAGSSILQNYRISVCNPFREGSMGVKALDGFSFPTQTRNLKGRFTMGTTLGQGSAAVALLPNPVVSALDLTAYNTNGSGNAIVNQGSLTAFGGTNTAYGATNVSGMVNQFETYRDVCVGFKIRVVMPELTRTGIITCAPFLCNEKTPGYNALTSTGITNPNMYSSLTGGILPSVAGTSAILELPGAFEMSIPELGRQDIVLPCKPISPSAYHFHGTDVGTLYNATVSYGDQVGFNTATFGVSTAMADFQDIAAMGGFVGWLVHIDGVPASTSVVNIEYVYHMEGVPSINATTVAQPVPDAAPTPNVPAGEWLQTIRDIAYSPMFSMVTQGLDAMGVGSSGGHRQRRIR